MKLSDPYGQIPGYPFKPNYIRVLGLNMHYIDEGPAGGPLVLLLHGIPSWSYIYRNMITALSQNGFRVIAPDLIGFGKSQKLASSAAYSYEYHIDWITSFITNLDLNDIVLFGQDWGAVLGMHVAVNLPERFSGLILSNGVFLQKKRNWFCGISLY
ncbi:MAG: alpha/beta fold hydrolase [Bacteroidales bacterium]|nr:alpha/beta fold hydrolase [Bacteroidales bacterium]